MCLDGFLTDPKHTYWEGISSKSVPNRAPRQELGHSLLESQSHDCTSLQCVLRDPFTRNQVPLMWVRFFPVKVLKCGFLGARCLITKVRGILLNSWNPLHQPFVWLHNLQTTIGGFDFRPCFLEGRRSTKSLTRRISGPFGLLGAQERSARFPERNRTEGLN